MGALPLAVMDSQGKIIATLSEQYLDIAIAMIERLKHGGTLTRNGNFLYARGKPVSNYMKGI